MKNYFNLAAAHPWSVAILILLVSVASGSQLYQLKIHVSPQALAVESDSAKRIYERSVETFGADSITQVVIRDRNLFNHEILRHIRSTIDRIEALPFVQKTESLFNVPHLQVVDEFVSTAPYLGTDPMTAGEADSLRKAALENSFVRRILLSEDGTILAINVYLNDDADDADYSARAAEGIETAIHRLRPNVDEVFQIGMPSIRTFVRDAITQDQRVMLPLSVLVLFLSLLLFLRGLAAVIPLLTAGLSVLWILGGMAALGIPVTVMTAIVPVLVIIIGSTEDIHLISEYREAVISGYGQRRALVHMAMRKGLAVVLTFLTSYLGFLAVSANSIQLMREFGLVASTGLLLNFLITATLVPVCLRYLGENRWQHKTGVIGKRRDDIVAKLSEFQRCRKPWIILFTLMITVISVHGAFSVHLNNNIRNYLPEDSVVEEQTDTLHETLSGIESFSIVLDGEIEDTFLKSRYLLEIVEIQQYLERHPLFDASLSVADRFALLNGAVNDTGEAGLPDDDQVITELAYFIDRRYFAGYASEDFSRTRILVRHDLGSSQALNAALSELRAFMAENTDAGLNIDITGESILSNHAADQMASGQAKSLGIMLLVVFLVISFLFYSARAGVVALMVNTFPLIVLFGVMGYAGIPLDTSTSMIAVIALGICVDNTMHFLVRYNNELRRHRTEDEAIGAVLHGEFIPITASAVTLSLGLGVLAFSNFEPLVNFGLLSGMVILLAYCANFLITPMLLSAIRLTTIWELMAIHVQKDLTRHCALFNGLGSREIRRIIRIGQVREYMAGEPIICQKNEGGEMFVILEGEGEMLPELTSEPASDAIPLKTGDVFGCAAMVAYRTDSAKVVAMSNTKTLVLTRDSIHRLAKFHSYTAFQLYRNLSAILGTQFASRSAGFDSSGLTGREVSVHLRASSEKSILIPAFSRQIRGTVSNSEIGHALHR
ncbi:MAG: MMPL family transporter [Candidatus Thiodiazotropha sp. (ex Monitilora ramsayi)]|nr:MMPL family transporter [Candidatus Thiodiazotropha sp. (ex Monitilora ramsayi)]